MKIRMSLLPFFVLVQGCAGAVDVDRAVVKIYSTVVEPYYYCPWLDTAPYEVSGSGCIIAGDLILTNAHVVSDVTFLQVRREGDPKRYGARVVAVSHEADLALITVDNPAFFEGITPLELGDLPSARDQVTVFGYPEGGDALSTTQGVVSRIETWHYIHSGLPLLAVQIDAAINPGNSGGPAIADDRIIGVAMQTNTQAENMGYIIPVPVIRHFLEDIEDGAYEGFPSAGFEFQQITNQAITERFGLEEEQTGVLVTGLAWDSPASRTLSEGDVILGIDGYEVAGDGTIELQPGVRTSLDHLFSRRQIGESVPLEIVRDGSPATVEMTLDMTFDDICLIPNKIYDRDLEYLVYGGLVFMPLTENYLETWGSDWFNAAPTYLLDPYMYGNLRSGDRTGLAILAYTLPADVNSGYQDQYNVIVEEVDGQKVSDFAHLVRLVDSSTGDFLELRTNLGDLIVIDREEAARTGGTILEQYGIPVDRHVEG